MNITKNNEQILSLLKDISDVSTSLNIKTYIWGGMTIDVWEGRFLRDHHDTDGFVENLLTHKDELVKAYESLGYKVSFNENFSILRIDKDSIHAGFNLLQIKYKTAQWKHIGEHGSVFFPEDWLDNEPCDFYGVPVYTSGLKFEYAIKTKPALLNPEWITPREKDLEAIEYLKKRIKSENIIEEDIYKGFGAIILFFIIMVMMNTSDQLLRGQLSLNKILLFKISNLLLHSTFFNQLELFIN